MNSVNTPTPPTEDPRVGGMRTAKSLVVVNTGNGKGKSTAAFGTAMRARARGWPAHLFIHLEYQSRDDPDMALRFVDYGGELHRELLSSGMVGPDDACPILCVVVHNGASPWRAPTQAGDHMRLPPVFGDASPPPGLAAFHPWGYHPLDLALHRGREPVAGSVVSLIAAIEYAGPKGLPDVLRGPLLDTARGLNPRLRETVGDWLRLLARKYGNELPELEELMGYEFEELPPVTSRLVESIDAAIDEARSTGIKTGIEQGTKTGIEQERALLCRMAALKFGDAAVEDMAGLMAGVATPGGLLEVGECLIQSDTADRLLACIRDVLRRSAM